MDNKECNCRLPAAAISGTPMANVPNALANSLGVSPLYRQIECARWQAAAQVYHSSRNHSPPGRDQAGQTGALSSEDIGAMNRKRSVDNICVSDGHLELEAIAAVQELSSFVQSISVSEILPRTADLIFVNVKTRDDHVFTLELTMKGWRVASTHTDSMNGDYLKVDFHTKYFTNVKQLMSVINPGYDKSFDEYLRERLEQLQADDHGIVEDGAESEQGLPQTA